MLMAMPLLASTAVKPAPVNCEPWSVFEDLRSAVTRQGVRQGLDAEGRVHGDRSATTEPAKAFAQADKGTQTCFRTKVPARP